MVIDRFTLDDFHVLDRLKPAGWGNISIPHLLYCTRPFCYPWKAVLDNTIVGIGTAICLGETGWLAHIIVDSEYRNRGIGSSIVQHCVRFLTEEKKCRTLSLTATDEGFPIYKKSGFVEQTEYITYKRENDPACKSDTHDNIIPYNHCFEKEITALDKIASGESRECFFKDKLIDTMVYINDYAKVMGYYLPFGEGLVVAHDVNAGIELLKYRAQKSDSVTIPINTSVAIQQFLAENNFTEQKRARRMILGDPFAWKPELIYNRIGGYLG